jgi:hypothetical protein
MMLSKSITGRSFAFMISLTFIFIYQIIIKDQIKTTVINNAQKSLYEE